MPILQATCEYKNVNGCSIKADVFLPSAQHPPVILYLHGGGLISGSRRTMLNYQTKLYQKVGFAVVAADYRLAPETKLPFILDDIRDALQWLKDEGARVFNFNAAKIAVVGSSGGSYLSLLTGTFETKPQAIVSFYGYGDILADWCSQPHRPQQLFISKAEAEASVGGREKSTGGNSRYAFYFYCRQQGLWPAAVSGYSLADREKLRPFCPAYNVQPGYPPTLLLHGNKDNDVPVEQSVQMAQALDRQGVENELIIVKDGAHGFDFDAKNPEVKRAMERIITFLKKHLSG